MDVKPRSPAALTHADRAWLEGLIERMGPRLVAYVRRAYGRHDDHEDIVAETFLRAARNIVAIRASERPELYLLTTARNLCRDRFRRPPLKRLPDEHPESGSAGGVEADTLLASERREHVREAVAALPDDLREVVVLRLSTNLTFEQIAELLHIPLGTALSRMHSAVKRLRKLFGFVHEC